MARVPSMELRLAGVLALALATLVASAEVPIPTECPETDIGNNTVNLAHETDCTKYYGCSGGLKFEKQCPVMDAEGNRLYFNPVLQVCDWPQNVECELPYPRAAAADSSKAEIPTECPKVDGDFAVHLAHENDCTKFYKCREGKKYIMDCPAYNAEGNKLYFNATLQVCDYPDNVNCELPYPGTKEVIVPKAEEIPTECPKVDGEFAVHLAHESDCTKFYKCSEGKKYVMDCAPYNEEGDKLYFNATLQVCDYPDNVNCELPYPGAKEVIVPKAEAIPTECPKVDGDFVVHLAHESDCTKFYKCSRGKKYIMDCPAYNAEGDKLYFNATLQVCDYPWNVDCQQPSTSSIASVTPSVIPTSTSTETVQPTSTSTETVQPTSTSTETVQPTSTSTETTQPTSTSTETTQPTSTSTETIQPTSTSTGTSPSTSTHTPSITPSPTSIATVTPTDTVTPSVTPPPPVTDKGCVGSCPAVDPIAYTVLLPNEDCQKFCLCSNGVPYVQTCAGNLHFSTFEKTCAQPADAKCANGPYGKKHPFKPQPASGDDEAVMNILGFNDRFRW